MSRKSDTNLNTSPDMHCPYLSGEKKLPLPEHPTSFSFSSFLRFLAGTIDTSDITRITGDVPERPPEIGTLWLTHQCVNNLNSPHLILENIRSEYGENATFILPNGAPLLVTADPHFADEILKLSDRGSGKDSFDKSTLVTDGAHRAIGRINILSSSNDTWSAQHKMLSRFFARGQMDNPEIIAIIKTYIEQWLAELTEHINASSDGVELDLALEMSTLTLGIATKVIFGREFEYSKLEEIADAGRSAMKMFFIEGLTPFDFPHYLTASMSESSHKFIQAVNTLNSFADELIEHERKHPSTPPNVLTALVKASSTSTPLLSRDAVRNNIITLLIASYEPGASALGFCAYQLLQNSNHIEQVSAEKTPTKNEKNLTLKQLTQDMPFTWQAVNEALRLHPSVYLVARRATKDLELKLDNTSLILPEGTEVVINIYGSNRNQQYWGVSRTGFDAEEFAPERWNPENLNKYNLSQSDLQHLSFGAGPRVCIGKHLFMTQALLILTEYFNRFEITPTENSSLGKLTSDAILVREGGYPVLVKLKSNK